MMYLICFLIGMLIATIVLACNNDSLTIFQTRTGHWGEKTFKRSRDKKAAIRGLKAHIKLEATELNGALDTNHIKEESSDILILLCGIAYLLEFDLLEEAKRKMKINHKRTWGKPDENNVIEHID